MAVDVANLHSLPICPCSKTLRSLPPSQQTSILNHISLTLLHALSLPDDKLSKLSCADFISSYVRDGASDVLNVTIFPELKADSERRNSTEKTVRKRVLQLAQRLAALPKAGGLSLQTILDLCIVYGPRNSARTISLLDAAIRAHPTLLKEINLFVIPSFAHILVSADSGLHALRKTLFCLLCFLRSAPPEVIGVFAQSSDFVLTLAKCYDTRLSTIAAGYGGIHIDRSDETGTTALWVSCKAALIDCFHVLLQHILNGVRADPRANAEKAFDLVFALLHLPSSSSNTSSATPFLNRPLIADYQEAYALAASLTSVFANADDPRLDVLDTTLKSFETTPASERAGALKILLHSSGAPPGIDNRGSSSLSRTNSKGKGRAETGPEPANAADLDMAVSKVLDVLPDYDIAYVRALLVLPQYDGNAERVVAALLEGDAPEPRSVELQPTTRVLASTAVEIKTERRNIFNEQIMEASNVTIGKRRDDAETVLQDRSFLEQMKEDILRRAAELSDDEEEEAKVDEDGKKVRFVAFEDELDDELDEKVKVAGDGEGSSDDGEEEEEDDAVEDQTPETILELAYIRDPKVFDRDGDTRRSKARAELKAQTKWSDEQIEGWRIMLERNPKKDKILQKHEFAGNKRGIGSSEPRGSTTQHNDRGRERGRGGRGRGRAGAGGRGGGGAGGERAWKDKNKARQANHNRKRGHDKKMARGGAIPGPPS